MKSQHFFILWWCTIIIQHFHVCFGQFNKEFLLLTFSLCLMLFLEQLVHTVRSEFVAPKLETLRVFGDEQTFTGETTSIQTRLQWITSWLPTIDGWGNHHHRLHGIYGGWIEKNDTSIIWRHCINYHII